MNKLYYIATGRAKEVIEAFFAKRALQQQARKDFLTKHGAVEEYFATDKGIDSVYFEKDKIPQGWKPASRSGFANNLVILCKPTSDKLGKSIRAEMKSLRLDGLDRFSSEMGAAMWLDVNDAGCMVIRYLVPEKVGNEWIVIVPDISQAKDWSFEGLNNIKASEYWAMKGY